MSEYTERKSIADLNWQMKITGSSTAFVRLHFKAGFSPDPGPNTPVPLFLHNDSARTLWNDFLTKVEELPCHESTVLGAELYESQLVFLIICRFWDPTPTLRKIQVGKTLEPDIFSVPSRK